VIVTEMYDGQGLGNQLWLYVVTRVKSEDLKCNFGIMNPEKFKGHKLFDLDFGLQVFGGEGPEGGPPKKLPNGVENYYYEPQSYYVSTRQGSLEEDPDFFNISKNTKIDGTLQNENYILHKKDEIRIWLKSKENDFVKSLLNEDLCIINFRGGEYRYMHDVFLPKTYWDSARLEMLKINPKMSFKVVSDDPKTADMFFPKSEILDLRMEEDYSLLEKANYLILSNSSFGWFPAWLNINLKFCIAPKYWWGHNSNSHWSCAYSLTRGWHYLDLFGNLFNYDECFNELQFGLSPRSTDFNIESVNLLNFSSVLHSNLLNLKSLLIIKYFKSSHFLKNKYRFIKGYFTNKFRINKSHFLILSKLNYLPNRIYYFFKIRTGFSFYEYPLFRSFLPEYRDANPLVIRGKTYDCFYFLNELDILEIRLSTYYNLVDYFVICESDTYFGGGSKPFTFKENRERFSKFDDKIIYLPLYNIPRSKDSVRAILHNNSESKNRKAIARSTLLSKNIGNSEEANQWVTEYFFKESIFEYLKGLDISSLIFVSDVDEFWNYKARFKIPKCGLLVFKQIPFVYFLNNRSNESWHGWTGSVAFNVSMLDDNSINELRTHNHLRRKIVMNGGWHFTFQGGFSVVSEKLKDWDKAEFKHDSSITLDQILDSRIDLRGRNIKYRIDDEGLPDFIIENRERYTNMFLDVPLSRCKINRKR